MQLLFHPRCASTRTQRVQSVYLCIQPSTLSYHIMLRNHTETGTGSQAHGEESHLLALLSTQWFSSGKCNSLLSMPCAQQSGTERSAEK